MWGAGSATDGRLAAVGVATAAGLRDLEPRLARKMGTVALERLVLELRGVPCLLLELALAARKGLAVTRSFGRPVTDPAELLKRWRPTRPGPARSCAGRGWRPGS